ncbi:MAG TPA: hypothetical protein VJ777_23625, partial [Mycobacterium sp.]|nr:hypothetical protein [Mycobacterium sp.]
MSVCDHLVSPGSAGLFRAAILMSAPCQAQADLAAATRRSLDYAAAAGCPDIAVAATVSGAAVVRFARRDPPGLAVHPGRREQPRPRPRQQ